MEAGLAGEGLGAGLSVHGGAVRAGRQTGGGTLPLGAGSQCPAVNGGQMGLDLSVGGCGQNRRDGVRDPAGSKSPGAGSRISEETGEGSQSGALIPRIRFLGGGVRVHRGRVTCRGRVSASSSSQPSPRYTLHRSLSHTHKHHSRPVQCWGVNLPTRADPSTQSGRGKGDRGRRSGRQCQYL